MMRADAEVVVLLTTWNRPELLRQSLPQILAETERVDGQLVVCDDRSDEPETVELLDAARGMGGEVIRPPGIRLGDRALDGSIHAGLREGMRLVALSSEGAELVSLHARRRGGPSELREALIELWHRHLDEAHLSAQASNLCGFRHVLRRYPRAAWILKVDDDVVVQKGAFERMLTTWTRAESDGHDVVAVSGIRTVYELPLSRFPDYVVTQGICSVAVLYKSDDWRRLLKTTPRERILREGFDLVFTWCYAPRHRPRAVAVAVTPSVVYHTGRNGLHVRDHDLNCEYGGATAGIVVR